MTVHVERHSPEATFSLLGNETRVAILQALAESPNEPTSFSAIRERVGERDSGKFNYHLKKLTGTFVRRTDDGYELTVAGMQVVGALIAGTYTADATMDPVDVDDPCPNCGSSPLRVEYDDEYVRVRCPSCEAWENRFPFPPGTLDQYEAPELPAAFDRWMRTVFERIVAGFCHNCAGRMRGELQDTRDDEDETDDVRVEWLCDRCGELAMASPRRPLLHHPAVIGFAYDHGVDLTRTPSWRTGLSRATTDVDVVSEDPLRAAVTVTLDGDTCTATLDPDGTVASVERSDR